MARVPSPSSEVINAAIPRNAVACVRQSCAKVAADAKHVQIDSIAVRQLVNKLSTSAARRIFEHEWDGELHLGLASAGDALTAQYLLVLDALNFCFWPQPGLEYEHLARGLKNTVKEDKDALSAARLAAADGETVQNLLQRSQPLPLQEKRAALLREIGSGLQRLWGGQALQLVMAANGSAADLVDAVLHSFPGFRDRAFYRGEEVWLLKRAQIFVADVWGAFEGKGPGEFHDVGCLTAFADYRVPVVLRQMGVLRYSSHLAQLVDHRQPLIAGSEEEIEIRACTIVAVEELRQAFEQRFQAASVNSPERQSLLLKTTGPDSATTARPKVNSIYIDWWLWETGEAQRTGSNVHHRTLTTFY